MLAWRPVNLRIGRPRCPHTKLCNEGLSTQHLANELVTALIGSVGEWGSECIEGVGRAGIDCDFGGVAGRDPARVHK